LLGSVRSGRVRLVMYWHGRHGVSWFVVVRCVMVAMGTARNGRLGVFGIGSVCHGGAWMGMEIKINRRI